MLRILNAVICSTHRVYSISKIVSEFADVEFTETDSYLGKMRQTYWVINTKDRLCRGGERIIDKSLGGNFVFIAI